MVESGYTTPSQKHTKHPFLIREIKRDSVRKKLEKDFLWQIKTLSSGDYIIAGRNGYFLEGKTYKIKLLGIPGDRSRWNFTYQDAQKRIWIGTTSSLHCFDSSMVYLKKVPANRQFRSMQQISPVEFLVGSSDGLYRMTIKGEDIEYKKEPGVAINSRIDLIVKDKKGICWIGTNEGLYRYDMSDMGSGRISLYNYADNIQGYSYEMNCFFYTPKEDMLFLGGRKGINYFHPSGVLPPRDSLIVSLIQVKINSDDTAYYLRSSPFDLSYKQRSLEFEFVAPYYNNAEKVMYRYELKGYDKDWRYIGNSNYVRLTSLPSGEYSFYVQASLDGKKWFENAEPFSFRIRPPFWGTWWFLSLLSVLVLLIIFRWIMILRSRIHSEKLLNYFATSLYGQNTVEDVFRNIAENCITQLGFQDCVIYQYDEQKMVLVRKTGDDAKNPETNGTVNPVEIAIGRGIRASWPLPEKRKL
jgi:hypothetical protein